MLVSQKTAKCYPGNNFRVSYCVWPPVMVYTARNRVQAANGDSVTA